MHKENIFCFMRVVKKRLHSHQQPENKIKRRVFCLALLRDMKQKSHFELEKRVIPIYEQKKTHKFQVTF